MNQPPLTPQQLESLDALLDKCNAFIQVDDPNTGGDIMCDTAYLSAKDLPLLASNPDQFWADHNGVTLERYRQWKAWRIAGCPCTAKNKKGKPCRQFMSGDVTAAGFKPGESDRCDSHHIGVLVDQAADPNCDQRVLDNLEPLLSGLLGDVR